MSASQSVEGGIDVAAGDGIGEAPDRLVVLRALIGPCSIPKCI